VETADGVERATTTSVPTTLVATEADPGVNGEDPSDSGNAVAVETGETTTTTSTTTATTTTTTTTTTSTPATSSTTTTTTAAEQAPTKDEAAPTEAGEAVFEIVKVNPVKGPTDGGTMATIVGRLPERASVRFGEAPAKIITAGDGFFVVKTSTAPAGVVDVVVKDSITAEEYILTSGFEYVTEDAATDNGSDDETAGEDTESDGSPSTTAGPTGDPQVTTTTPTTDGNSASLDDWLAGKLVTPKGLVRSPLPAGRFSGINLSLLAANQCSKPICPGWIIGPGVHRPGGPPAPVSGGSSGPPLPASRPPADKKKP
jgi:guanyl-specific ribonuclease Sa